MQITERTPALPTLLSSREDLEQEEEQSEYDSNSDIETPGESRDESDNLGNIAARDVDFLVGTTSLHLGLVYQYIHPYPLF